MSLNNFDTIEWSTIQNHSSNIKYYMYTSQLLPSISSLEQGLEKSENLTDPLTNAGKQCEMFSNS